jgi:OmpA-OmpF porin, OOP family
MKVRSTLLASASLAVAAISAPLAARAQPIDGVYVGANLGYNQLGSEKLKNVPGQPSLSFHGGYVADIHAGYGFGDGVRVELEGSYTNNQVDKAHYNGQQTASGNEAKYGIMANVLYDLDLGVPYFYPYIGGGVGVQYVDFKGVHVPDLGVSADYTRPTFAYQGIAGFSTPIPGVAGLSTDVEYRYLGTTGSRTYRGTIDNDYAVVKVGNEHNNQITLGLRYAFGQEAPPPPAPVPVPVAAPAPAPVKTFLVFFDWDKYSLTARATQIIAQAAAQSRTVQTTQINVSGYTDTSGTARYNETLSLRRAQSVAAQLVADGVAQTQIEIHAFGETHLLVQTGPGVREPQNRRVEIVLD